VDYELVMYPTWEGVHELVRQFGYSVVTLKPRFEDYAGVHSYQSGERRAFLCAKRTVISRVPVEIEQVPPVAPPPMPGASGSSGGSCATGSEGYEA